MQDKQNWKRYPKRMLFWEALEAYLRFEIHAEEGHASKQRAARAEAESDNHDRPDF